MKTNRWFNHSNRLRSNLRITLGSALVIASAAMLLAAAAPAGTRYVAPSGTDTGNCTDPVHPCLTISYAVSQASPGNTVSVAAGTYTESVLIDKRLSVVGHNATLDASGHDNGFVISGSAASRSVLRGFTVENAGLEGIFARMTSNLTIAGNTVIYNDAYGVESELCVNQPDDCGEAIHLQSVKNSKVNGNLVQNNVGGILLTDEDGPTSGNVITNNRVLDNTEDCGITLASHWFQFGSPVAAGVAGVYHNIVRGNTSSGNGAAGIGIFAGPPGAAAWGNTVVGNTAANNGLPGVAIHSHTPFQYVNNNVITHNVLSGNGPDFDAQATEEEQQPTGISVFSDASAGAAPIQHTTITKNTISDEYYGIFTVNAVKLTGLQSNIFVNVTVPISIH